MHSKFLFYLTVLEIDCGFAYAFLLYLNEYFYDNKTIEISN